MVKPLGQINFILEDSIQYLIEELGFSWSDILFLFFNELKEYPNDQEEYYSGGNPILKLTKKGKKINFKKKPLKVLDKSQEKILKKLIKNYVINHEMQWGEVLHLVHGYLAIHRPDAKDCEFYYGY